MSLGLAERAALVAIVESSDSRVTANERLRAIELLQDSGGSDDDGTLLMARWVAGLEPDQLADELHGLFADPQREYAIEDEVERRVAERLPEAVEARISELRDRPDLAPHD